MSLTGGTCPSLETIGAFVDGRFKQREREMVADHLGSCESCYFVFAEAARVRVGAQPTGEVRTFVPRIPWRLSAGLAAAASMVIAANLWISPGANPDQRALEQLVTAVGTARTFDARPAGGFAYAPVRGPVRGAAFAEQLSPDARIAIAQIEKLQTTGPIAGTAALIAGDVDRAIGILENAARTAPADARALNDLSAAYLVRAERTGNTADASRGLAMANRALEIERLMPEALYNRALALQMSGLTEDARQAWQAFLTIDDRSGWADDARARLRILSSQP
jgi:tetratricopeptide (TPR) repeat protein